MLPTILISNNSAATKVFAENVIKKHSISHSLVFTISPLKSEITINQIRDIRKELITVSSQKRLFIIESFDTAAAEAQNALLKTLEEKQESTIFILVANRLAKVLPTIQSRSKVINTVTTKSVLVSSATAQFLESLPEIDNFSFLSDTRIASIGKEEAMAFLYELVSYYRGRFLQDQTIATGIVKKALQLRELIQNNNINPQLAVDNILIFIQKTYTMK